MLEEFLEDIKELKKYKEKYKCSESDKEKMSNLLYEYMMKEYKEKDYKTRVNKHISEFCKNCRYYYGDNEECKWLEGTPKSRLPQNILEPIKSKTNFIPGQRICKDFYNWD